MRQKFRLHVGATTKISLSLSLSYLYSSRSSLLSCSSEELISENSPVVGRSCTELRSLPPVFVLLVLRKGREKLREREERGLSFLEVCELEKKKRGGCWPPKQQQQQQQRPPAAATTDRGFFFLPFVQIYLPPLSLPFSSSSYLLELRFGTERAGRRGEERRVRESET